MSLTLLCCKIGIVTNYSHLGVRIVSVKSWLCKKYYIWNIWTSSLEVLSLFGPFNLPVLSQYFPYAFQVLSKKIQRTSNFAILSRYFPCTFVGLSTDLICTFWYFPCTFLVLFIFLSVLFQYFPDTFSILSLYFAYTLPGLFKYICGTFPVLLCYWTKFKSFPFKGNRAPEVGGLEELARVLGCRVSHPWDALYTTMLRFCWYSNRWPLGLWVKFRRLNIYCGTFLIFSK